VKLVIIPPYKNPVAQPGLMLTEILAEMEKKGQLNGIEVDIDEGYFPLTPWSRLTLPVHYR